MRRAIAFVGAIVTLAVILPYIGIEPGIFETGGAFSTNRAENVSGVEFAEVIRVIDGDTIEVKIEGREYRVRYAGVNTPERNEPCYQEATVANRALVQGKTLSLFRDISNIDQYGRLLRYVYADQIFVNQELIRQGYAESVRYEPDERHFDEFRILEREAAGANRGCHSTGIFDDGTDAR